MGVRGFQIEGHLITTEIPVRRTLRSGMYLHGEEVQILPDRLRWPLLSEA